MSHVQVMENYIKNVGDSETRVNKCIDDFESSSSSHNFDLDFRHHDEDDPYQLHPKSIRKYEKVNKPELLKSHRDEVESDSDVT